MKPYPKCSLTTSDENIVISRYSNRLLNTNTLAPFNWRITATRLIVNHTM